MLLQLIWLVCHVAWPVFGPIFKDYNFSTYDLRYFPQLPTFFHFSPLFNNFIFMSCCSIFIKSDLCTYKFLAISYVDCFYLLIDSFEKNRVEFNVFEFSDPLGFWDTWGAPKCAIRILGWVGECSHAHFFFFPYWTILGLGCNFFFPITHVRVVLFDHEKDMFGHSLSLEAHVVASFSWFLN